MDIQTINQEEFDKLHPAMKEYLKAGIDTNRYGSDLVTEKNFFNMNLFNADPEDLDPDIIERTEKARTKPNYLAAGFMTGLSHTAELIGSIPGGLDRFYDWGRTTLGFQPTEDSIFDYAEDYLKDIAHDLGPEYKKDFIKPEGYLDKVWYGLGMAIPVIASYHPFIRGTAKVGQTLQAVKGIGKTARALQGTGKFLQRGGGLPAGIAITDMTREIDDGRLADIATAGAYGYGTGVVLNIANKLNILPRMAGLGAFGYLSAGSEANNEDRLAAATVWGTLGILGPLAEGKPIKRELTNIEIQTKQLLGMQEKPVLLKDVINQKIVELKDAQKQFADNPAPTEKGMIQQKKAIDKLETELRNLEIKDSKLREEPVRGVLAEHMYANEVRISEHKSMLENSKEAIKFEEANAKRVEEGNKPLPTPENLRDKIMTPEQVQKHEKFIKDLAEENVGYGKIVWTNHNYNQAILGFDRRPTELFKQDMYKPDGTPKYADMRDTNLPDFSAIIPFAKTKTQETKIAGFVIPPKFINHPVVKYINDQIAISKQKVETIVEQIAYDPMFASDKIFAPGRKKLDTKGDYLLRLQGAAEAVRLVGMRKIKTDGGGLTRFSLLRETNPEKAKQIVDAAWRIEIDQLKEAKKNGESYSTRVDANENLRRQSKRQPTPDELRRIEELQQSRTEDNAKEIDAEIGQILGTDPFLPIKPGGFKYEVTDAQLRKKYKFDQDMIDIYRQLRTVVDKTVDIYNQKVKENKEKGLEAIEKIPNYFPHIFQGDFAVFVKKWSGNKKGYRPIEAPGAPNKLSVNALRDFLMKEYNAIDVSNTNFNNRQRLSSDYVVQVVKRDRDKAGSEAFNSFNELFTRFELTDEAFIKVQEKIDKIRRSTGFKKFALQRQNVDGFLGSELNARQEFVKKIPGVKGLSEKNLATRQTAEFETAILQYLQGGIEAANRIEFNTKMGQVLNRVVTVSDGKGGTRKTTIGKDYPTASKVAEDLKSNAFGEASPLKFIEKLSEMGSDYIGKSGLTRILGGANQVTLNAKLLFGNMRFLMSQIFQPYHMIAPRLFDLQYSGFDKGKVSVAQITAFKQLLNPNKEYQQAGEYAYRNHVVDQKFLNEAVGNLKGIAPKLQLPANMKDLAGRKVIDWGRIMKIISLQDLAGKAEQVSRLNSFYMFYSFFRQNGKSKEFSKEAAAFQTNKHMVEYNYLERPQIYGEKGLGAFGKIFGLFKTFQHNYLAQLSQYIKTATESKEVRGGKEYANVAGLVGFMTQMVFSAGVFGLIGYESAERLLRTLSPTVEKLTGKPLPSFTETILTSDLPDVVKYGAPSSALGIDLTATLAAPGVNLGDLISVPALDYLGLNPLNGFAQGKGRGFIPAGYNALITAIASDSAEEKREAAVKFYSAIAPSSMQVFIEQYYNGLPMDFWSFWSPNREFTDAHKSMGYMNIQKDVFKRGRGEVQRTFHDWFARTMASYSLEEKEALKLVYVTTQLKRNLRDDISGYLTAGAQHMMKEGFIPLYIIERLSNYGLTFDQIYERITNRTDLMNTTILDRLIKKTNAMKHNDRINALRNMAISRGFNFEG